MKSKKKNGAAPAELNKLTIWKAPESFWKSLKASSPLASKSHSSQCCHINSWRHSASLFISKSITVFRTHSNWAQSESWLLNVLRPKHLTQNRQCSNVSAGKDGTKIHLVSTLSRYLWALSSIWANVSRKYAQTLKRHVICQILQILNSDSHTCMTCWGTAILTIFSIWHNDKTGSARIAPACVKSFIEHAKLTPFKPSPHLDKANFGGVNSTFFLLGKTISRMIAAPVLLNIFGYMFCLLRESWFGLLAIFLTHNSQTGA